MNIPIRRGVAALVRAGTITAFLLGVGAPAAMAQSAFWNTGATTGGSWTNSLNWQGGTVPSGAANAAGFNLDFTAGSSVTLDGDRTIGTILSTGANPWSLDSGTSGTLTVSNIFVTGGTMTVSTPRVGVDFTKDGSGKLTITSSNGLYSGVININAGTLNLAGSGNYSTGNNAMHISTGAILDVTQLVSGSRYGGDPSTRMAVNNGDVLDGTGTVKGGLKVKSGGTVYPGFNGVGSLTVDGKGTFEAGSIWKVKLGTANASSSNVSNRLDFSGALTLEPGMNIPIDGNGMTFNAFQTYDYIVATSADGLFGLGAVNFQPTNFSPSEYATPAAFSFIADGDNLKLRFSPVPEPACILAICFGLAAGTGSLRRRGSGRV